MIVSMNKMSHMAQLRFGKNTPIVVMRALTICVLLLLMWALGRLSWVWVTSEQPTMLAINNASSSNIAPVPGYQINQLLSQNLFGKFQDKPTISAPAATNAPKTTLNLTLFGVVASTDPQMALAVIGNGTFQQVYGIGETIKNSKAILSQVMPDRVVLRNNRRDEILMLNGERFEVNKNPPPQQLSKKVNTTANPGSDNDLQAVKAEILKNPQSLLKYITLAQQRNEQGVTGYRIGPGRDKRLFEQSGLQANDLVVGINGSDLRDPSGMAKIWQNLSDASEINLTVVRNGQEYNVLIGL